MDMTNWPSVDDVPPITAAELGAVLAMIGVNNNWRTKAKIVGLIGSREGGDWWTAEEVAASIDKSHGRARMILTELARERVLLRDGGGSRDSRVFWVEVNPNIEGWLNVDWLVSRFERGLRLAMHRERAFQSARERFIARPISARRALVIARLMGARSVPGAGGLSRAIETRDNGGGGGGGSRAIGTRDVGGQGRAPVQRASFGAAAPVVVSPSSDDANSSSSSGAGGAGGGDSIDPELERRARAAVLKKASAQWINGAPLAKLRALLVDVPSDDVLGAISRAPDGLGVPRLVEWLECHAGVELVDDVAPVVDPIDERRTVEASIANRRSMLEVYERTDADPELIERCRDELAAWETRLAELEKQEGAA